MIRAIPSNAADNVYCTLLAQSAVHGAMAGYTGFVSGLVNGRQTYIPFNVKFLSLSLHIYLYRHIYTKTYTFWKKIEKEKNEIFVVASPDLLSLSMQFGRLCP